MTIYVNEEHLGEATEEQARRFVELMQQRGWGIEYGTGPEVEPFHDIDRYEADADEVLGYISTEATNEQIDSLNAVMTAAEAVQEFGLSDAAVRQAINRGTITARQSGATWLILRSEAEARWGQRLNEWTGDDNEVTNADGYTFAVDAALVLVDHDIMEEMEHDCVDLEQPQWFAQYAARHVMKYGEKWELAKVNPTW